MSLESAADAGSFISSLANSDVDVLQIQVVRKPTTAELVTGAVVFTVILSAFVGCWIWFIRSERKHQLALRAASAKAA